jgi:glycosyltransferase involved in cell wall biosynthesis
MRILVLTFYYPPDLAAGSFRAKALVDAMEPLLGAGDRIDVVTTLPQRYAAFRPDAPQVEERERVHIRRFAIPSHRSGMIDQSRAFVHFARRVLHSIRSEGSDLVFATSSRLMTAALGARIAHARHAPLYLDIRDIFSDTMDDILSGWRRRMAMPVVNRIERYAIGAAARVNLVSPGFGEYFRRRYPQHEYRFFTNGIDEEFLHHDYRASAPHTQRVLLYAGNIGAGQGLEHVLPELTGALGADWRVRVIGAGAGLERLRRALAERPASNAELVPPLSRTELVEQYRAADCLFLHLNAYDAFLKVLPSKLFEYAATGKPILAGVAGYCADFIRAEVENAQVFTPCDAADALVALRRLKLQHTPRAAFVQRYRRDVIMRAMARDVVSAAHP